MLSRTSAARRDPQLSGTPAAVLLPLLRRAQDTAASRFLRAYVRSFFPSVDRASVLGLSDVLSAVVRETLAL